MFLEQVDAVLGRFDKDSSGTITRVELSEGLRELGITGNHPSAVYRSISADIDLPVCCFRRRLHARTALWRGGWRVSEAAHMP